MTHFASFLAIFLILASAACSSRRPDPVAQAPEGSAVQPGPVTFQTPPVHALIGHRERLELTSEQITALDSIGTWLQRANGPAMAELRNTMGGGRAAMVRPGAGRANEEALPIIERIQENNRAAVEGVREALSEEQQSQVCELFESQPGAGRMMRGAGGGGGGGMVIRRPGGGGGQGAIVRQSPWPWCTPPADDMQPEGATLRSDE